MAGGVKIGSTTVNSMYFGTTPITALYQGANLVFPVPAGDVSYNAVETVRSSISLVYTRLDAPTVGLNPFEREFNIVKTLTQHNEEYIFLDSGAAPDLPSLNISTGNRIYIYFLDPQGYGANQWTTTIFPANDTPYKITYGRDSSLNNYVRLWTLDSSLLAENIDDTSRGYIDYGTVASTQKLLGRNASNTTPNAVIGYFKETLDGSVMCELDFTADASNYYNYINLVNDISCSVLPDQATWESKAINRVWEDYL